MEIFLPKRFEDADIVNFLRELVEHKDDEKVCTDYSKVEFVKPFATLLLAIGVLDFLKYRHTKGLKTTSKGHKKNTTALSYLQHLGFFQFIGLNIGKQPSEAAGSSRYLPITELKESQFDIEGKRLQDEIVKESMRLAQIIYPGDKNIMKAEMLSYCLREVIRNVFEHADINECFVVAQKWADGFAEIAIADRGIGLTESLKQSHKITNAEDAITTAIKPGISSDSSPENDDKWQNSGFGLYVVSELGSMMGEFALASDDKIMFSSNGEEKWFDVPIHGTAVKLKVDTNEADYWPNIQLNIVTQGEALAQDIPGAKKKASKMSKVHIE